MVRIKIKVILCLPALLLIVGFIVYFRSSFLIDQSSPLIKNNLHYKLIIKKYQNTVVTGKDEITRVIKKEPDEITIVVVICGFRSKEALLMIKSAIIFQKSARLHFILLSEYNLQNGLKDNLQRMQSMTRDSFSYELLNLSFPINGEKEWRYLFQPCAAQRLFLPNVLESVKEILYVDTDVLFLNDLHDIWQHFGLMNSSQMSALAPEQEDLNTGWYNRFARHPYYGKLGVNSGVMLMNLTKMREFRWVDYLSPILKQFRYNLTWGDQDIINIIFSYHPEKLYVYSCRYNYRTDHCMYRSVCKDAEINGVSVIHGSRGAFHSDKQATFKAIYRVFSQFEIGSDPVEYLLKPLKFNLDRTSNTSCGAVKNIFLKNLITLFSGQEVEVPPVLIDLRNFNECCFARFNFFLQLSDIEDYESPVEAIIQRTKMDQIGHFILRCVCLCSPVMKDFILERETDLFLYRLEQQTVLEMRLSCQTILKDMYHFRDYKVFNPFHNCEEKPYFAQILLSAMQLICETLQRCDVSEHFKMECWENCQKYSVRVPFQVCQSLIKTRDVAINYGVATVVCCKWNKLLEQLFIHHYELGLEMISRSVLSEIIFDVRWVEIFNKLTKSYESYKKNRRTPHQELTAKHVDSEKDFFPPCMSHLLTVLRSHHRLSHRWRFNFSLFLKDIGLSVNESLEFWRNEYSKSCTPGTSCTHSWQANHKKYAYSIRHLYGLEGSKIERISKCCSSLQKTALGMREEGGCPFVHFDESNLLETLSHEVTENADIISQILLLRTINQPLKACSLYMSSLIETFGSDKKVITIEYESPLEYYFNLKSCLNKSLQW